MTDHFKDAAHYRFTGALDELLLGGRIARGSWPKVQYLFMDEGPSAVIMCKLTPLDFSLPWRPRRDDLNADDWIIVTGEHDHAA